MSFSVLIPARLASTRLPNKPLTDLAGLPMVVRTARRSAQSGADAVYVAADDARIAVACALHGVHCVLTRTDHASGSDRLGEACELLGLSGDDIVVNVQGDEPLIEPELIDRCADLLTRRLDCVMGTAAHVISEAADFIDANVVKVVCDAAGRALYFSRAPIPCWRDGSVAAGRQPPAGSGSPAFPAGEALRHVGIYSYRAAFLRRFSTLAPSPLEVVESLEQLRVLWHGERIAVHLCAQAAGVGVDTPADLDRVRAMLAGGRVPS